MKIIQVADPILDVPRFTENMPKHRAVVMVYMMEGCPHCDMLKPKWETVKKILKNAIIAGGSTINNYHNSEGKVGSYQKNFKVYDREGKGCLRNRCRGKIRRLNRSGRSIFYCSICQT